MYAGQIYTVGMDGRSGRVFLDFLRFFLAAVVVLGHVTQPVFSSSFPDLTKYSVLAVGGFFVLSGYTIRAITVDLGRVDPLHFMIGRASRLLSVSLYALVVTVFCDTVSRGLSPDFYFENFSSDADMPALRVVANVFFLSQLWGMDVSPLSNSPFWSLGYEAAFYAIWAAYLAARKGSGWFYVVLIGLVFGPNILVMFPFWLLGVFLYEIEHFKGRSAWLIPLLVVLGAACVGCTLLFGFVGGLAGLSDLNRVLVAAVSDFFAIIHVKQARVQVNLMVGAVVFFVALIPALAFARIFDHYFVLPSWLGRFSGFAGGLTFPMYLLHFPMLLLGYVSKVFEPSSPLHCFYFFSFLILFSNLVGLGADSTKQMLRNFFVSLADRLRGSVFR